MLFIEVRKAAEFLSVSTRRVRLLLAQGRILGHKNASGQWLVSWPFEVTPGKRGPDLKRFPIRKIYPLPPPAARARQGRGEAQEKNAAKRNGLTRHEGGA